MKRFAISVLLVTLGSASATTSSPLQLLGRFDNVESPDQGEHCHGYSLDLWDANGRVLGLLRRHSGLCGDPPCAVLDPVSFDRRTGRLTFSSRLEPETFRFVGHLRDKSVIGELNGRTFRLDGQPPVAGRFEPDTSVAAWCSFWKDVPRCTGVKEVCAGLQ
jgi:hypothetical protein